MTTLPKSPISNLTSSEYRISIIDSLKYEYNRNKTQKAIFDNCDSQVADFYKKRIDECINTAKKWQIDLNN